LAFEFDCLTPTITNTDIGIYTRSKIVVTVYMLKVHGNGQTLL